MIIQEINKECLCLRLVRSTVGPKLLEWCALPVCGTLGGILIAWDPMEVLRLDEIVGNYSISIKMAEVLFGFEWMILGVYGLSRLQHHYDFWNKLLSVKGQWGGPWVVGGDFNVIRFTHEKSQHFMITQSMSDFNSFINQCDIRDAPLANAKFTWTDGRETPLLSRLDRFLVSNCWEEVYPLFT